MHEGGKPPDLALETFEGVQANPYVTGVRGGFQCCGCLSQHVCREVCCTALDRMGLPPHVIEGIISKRCFYRFRMFGQSSREIAEEPDNEFPFAFELLDNTLQTDRRIINGCSSRDRIPAVGYGVVAVPHRPPLNRSYEIPLQQRLGEYIVHACRKASIPVVLLGVSRNGYYRDLRSGAAASLQTPEFMRSAASVEERHFHIKKDEVVPVRHKQLHCLLPVVSGVDDAAKCAQMFACYLLVDRRIVRQQNAQAGKPGVKCS